MIRSLIRVILVWKHFNVLAHPHACILYTRVKIKNHHQHYLNLFSFFLFNLSEEIQNFDFQS